MGVNVDELLPLSRRLDWRFLLPDPSLNRVSYSGPVEAPLWYALQRFSRELVRGEHSHVDLSVSINPSLSEFSQSIRETNSFYVELSRPTWRQRLSQVAAPGSYIRTAAKMGFEAQAYWHYPNFEAATRIIPLSVASPLVHVVAKNRNDTKTRLKSKAMALLLETGVMARSVSCLSIVGYKA